LFTKLVAPGNLRLVGTSTHNSHTANWGVGPPIYYLASLFSLWRGSIKVKIKFVKTDFHTGRVMITWTPANTTVTPPTTTGNSMLSLRHIVDIRDGSEVELLLPYLIGVNYSILDSYNSSVNCSGQLDITILNELRAPETCSTAMDILIYFSGGEDLEFAGPGGGNVIPFSPQMADLDCGVIGGDKVTPQQLTTAQQSIGELFSSVKQLLNKYCILYLNYTPTISDQAIYIWPWVRGVFTINTSTGALVQPLVGGDTFSAISNMYLMYRGGARIMVYSDGSGPTFIGNSINTALNVSGTTFVPFGVSTQQFSNVTVSTTAGFSANAVNVQDSSDGVVFSNVPYYSRTKGTLAFNSYTDTTNKASTELSNSVSVLNVYRPTDTKCSLWRSFPDDFQCCYFIGAPPKLESYS